MLVVVLCYFATLLVLLTVNRAIFKKIKEQPIMLSEANISKAELMRTAMKAVLSFTIVLILHFVLFTDHEAFQIMVECVVAVYSAIVLYPLVNAEYFKGRMGLYNNGVMTFSGVILYESMNQYEIRENSNYSTYDYTVYCKKTLQFAREDAHFDIKRDAAQKHNDFLKRKHQVIKEKLKKKGATK